tara:strand:+ start:34756 stop:35469 length:714 start_codon:yes stop_codon:yes gene_type:complete
MSTPANYTLLESARFERKFVLENSSLSYARMLIKTSAGIFSPIYQKRRVNNVYFDTPNLTSYYENHFGKSDRTKIRVRWYGETFGDMNDPILEIKIKHGAAGKKKSYPLKSFHLKEGFSRQDWNQIFEISNLPDIVRGELKRSIPTLLNCYEREYFQSFNKVFRFTLDYNLKFFNVKSITSSFREKSLPEKTIILELKYDFKKDKEVKKITNALPIRLGKFSKYIRGVEIFNPHLAV